MKIIRKYSHWYKLVSLTFVLGLIISAGLYATSIYYIYGQNRTTCMTTTMVSQDSRCLFILSGFVYEKGTKSKPHQGQTCGTDVTSFIPSFHKDTVSHVAKYLDPNVVGQIQASCAAPATPTPTVRPPTNTPPVAATNTPVPTGSQTCSLKTLGDADCSGTVDLIDFEVWRKEKLGEIFSKNSDFDRNNIIDTIDFEIWRRNGVK